MTTSKPSVTVLILAGIVALLAAGCQMGPGKAGDRLVGAWRGKVQFKTGPFAATKDLEFMYVFNLGGTMTESSNYDASPPVPPAYGSWKNIGPQQYEATYAFYWNKPPTSFDELAKGGGWAPGGYGRLIQKITLSEDGDSFESTIKLEMFDASGHSAEGSGEATGGGRRI